jgi:hypothetical protein
VGARGATHASRGCAAHIHRKIEVYFSIFQQNVRGVSQNCCDSTEDRWLKCCSALPPTPSMCAVEILGRLDDESIHPEYIGIHRWRVVVCALGLQSSVALKYATEVES